MTLNQICQRLKTIVTAHRMVRAYDLQGLPQEFNNDHTGKYPSVNALIQPGGISVTGRKTTYGFVIEFEDLVNVSAETKMNEWDVVSDMASIAEDVLAQLLNPNYDDWSISGENSLQPIFDNENDRTAGVRLTISISTQYNADRCQVPSDEIIITDKDENVKVYDIEYIGTGNEGSSIDTSAIGSNLNVVTGKKIILVTRESAPLHKVSNNPDPAEYTWNDTVIGLGAPINQPIGGKGERFLILYRNY